MSVSVCGGGWVENHCSRRQRTQQSSGNKNRQKGKGAGPLGREGWAGRQWEGPGQRPRPWPRDPATCSCPGRRPSTEREGPRSSHSDCRACERFWTGSSPHRERGQHTAGPMEPPSGPASRRRVPWNRLLLAGERGQFSGRGQRLENKGLAGLWGRRGSERGQRTSVQA